MRVQRMLLIINPASRRATHLSDRTIAALRDAGASVDDVVTTGPGDAAKMALGRAGGYDAVFTLGGDGTALEVVSALAGTGCPVGILPGGTGNQLARLLDIPLTRPPPPRPSSAATSCASTWAGCAMASASRSPAVSASSRQ